MRKISKNKLLIRILLLIVISVLIGIFYLAILSKNNKNLVCDNLKLYLNSLNKLNYLSALFNCFSSNIFFLIIIGILGISIIGMPIIVLLLCYKGFVLGFSVSSILFFYKFNGILFCFIYILPLLFDLLIYLFFGYYAILFCKNLIKLLFMKKEINFKPIMRRYLKVFVFSAICLLFSSLIEIFLVPNIINLVY